MLPNDEINEVDQARHTMYDNVETLKKYKTNVTVTKLSKSKSKGGQSKGGFKKPPKPMDAHSNLMSVSPNHTSGLVNLHVNLNQQTQASTQAMVQMKKTFDHVNQLGPRNQQLIHANTGQSVGNLTHLVKGEEVPISMSQSFYHLKMSGPPTSKNNPQDKQGIKKLIRLASSREDPVGF